MIMFYLEQSSRRLTGQRILSVFFLFLRFSKISSINKNAIFFGKTVNVD